MTTCDHSVERSPFPPHGYYCIDCGVMLHVAEDTFAGLVSTAEAIMDRHYPTDIFVPPTDDRRDAGVQLVAALRAAAASRRQQGTPR